MKAVYFATVLFASTFTASAADSVIKVSGQVIDFGCTISTESKDFTVDLMKNSTKQFNSVGSSSPAVPFAILLTDCSDATSGVKVLFSGTADDDNRALLKLEQSTASAAGMAVEILDGQGQELPLNASNATQNWITIQPSQNNALPFAARLKTTRLPVRPGLVSASATFTLEFQ